MSAPKRADSPFEHLTVIDASGSEGDKGDGMISEVKVPEKKQESPRTVARCDPPTTTTGHKASTSALRFFVVDHPTKLKDRAQMRENRKHVMRDYLDKERRKPVSSDVRVTGSTGTARKRKRLDVKLLSPSITRTAPETAISNRQPSPCLVYSADEGCCSTCDNSIALRSSKLLATTSHRSASSLEQYWSANAENEAPLVRGVPRVFTRRSYLRTPLEAIPNPSVNPGSNINPFDAWPRFIDSSLNMEELKWSCSRKFGSHGIARHWIPQLLKAKHAFLSTLCISASHDDIMRRSIMAPSERKRYDSMEQIRIRGEVISMVNSAMEDPKQATADATIVAVLHLLNSEIMGCDDTVMSIHQQGLLQMTTKRGGLNHLGVDGHLASILTITNYLVSALRESEPHREFVRYAASKQTRPPAGTLQFPESPIFCRMEGFCKLNRALSPDSPTYGLLETLRLLTNDFVRSSAASLLNPTSRQQDENQEQYTDDIRRLHNRIFATKAADERLDDFATMSEKYTFEALRLTAVVYVRALTHKVPFSKAAAQLSASNRVHPQSPDEQPVPWHIHIQQALAHTDMSSCWGELAGVLFWCSLIASACAIPSPYATPSPSNGYPSVPISPIDAATLSDAEVSRKWLAAVAVRCKIVLAFEYGSSVLGTLKRVVGIEQALAQAERERAANMQRATVVIAPPPLPVAKSEEKTHYGPVEAPFVQRTFQDFALDFNESLR